MSERDIILKKEMFNFCYCHCFFLFSFVFVSFVLPLSLSFSFSLFLSLSVSRSLPFFSLSLSLSFSLFSQFLFIEGAEVPQIGNKPYKVKETIKPVSPTPRTYTPTNLISDNNLNYNNGNSTLILYDSTVQPEGGNYLLLYLKGIAFVFTSVKYIYVAIPS